MTGDSLGDRMKRYEAVTRTVLLPHSFTVLRVDGRAFHRYLHGAEKPYDMRFIDHMMRVGELLCCEVSGVVTAYGQSDEISLILSDVEPQSQPWFGGVAQKMASVAAGIATAALIGQRGTSGLPHFDARVFTLPSVTEVENYLIWRQRDAVRNSVSMAAQAKFSQSRLHGLNSGQMQELLWSECGINWNDYPTACRRGWQVVRRESTAPVAYTDKRTGEIVTTVVDRSSWTAEPATHYSPGFLTDPQVVALS